MSSSPAPYVSFSEIDKLLATREPVFIRNRTARPTKVLIVNYPTMEGPRAFHVPRTGIPFNICDYVDPESLRTSQSFRTMLLSGHIEVVDSKAARAELADPERIKAFRASYDEANNTYRARKDEAQKARAVGSINREEQQKLQAQGMKNIITAMDPTLAKALDFMGPDGRRQEPRLLEEGMQANVPNTRLNALEARVKTGVLDESAVIGELSLMLGDLTMGDLASIAANHHWPEAAQEWARERAHFMTKSSASASSAKPKEA